MRVLIRSALAGACLSTLVLAVPASAQSRPAQFTVEGKTYALDPPAGFCSEGPGVDAMREAEAQGGSPANDLILLRCGDQRKGEVQAYMLRVHRGASGMTRELLFDGLRRRPEWAPQAPSTDGSRGLAMMREALGKQVEMKARVAPIGFDESCAYLSGMTSTRIDPATPPVNLLMVSCTTVIGGYPMTIVQMTSKVDADAAVAALSELKRIVDSIR